MHQESKCHKDALIKSSNFMQIIAGEEKKSSVAFQSHRYHQLNSQLASVVSELQFSLDYHQETM
jgi:hypothetical protein